MEDHTTPIMAATTSNDAPPQLEPLTSPDDVTKESGDEKAKESLSTLNTTREASMRVAADNGEPPAIDKKTLLGLIAVYFSVFLDMMGISIVQPVLPFYAEKFGANSFELGALYSSYSLMATFASYAMGKASDKVECIVDTIVYFGYPCTELILDSPWLYYSFCNKIFMSLVKKTSRF